MTYCYQAFGLKLASELYCPQLPSAPGPADVAIRYGLVPPLPTSHGQQADGYQIEGAQCVLCLDQAAGARFLIRDGQEIIIDRRPESDDDTIRLYLFGSCMGALLYQRGVLPLHGSAVAAPQGAIIIAGASGSGKSTLAAALAQRGSPILADDLSAVTLDAAGLPLLHPGLPRLKLWAAALAHLAEPIASLERVQPGEDKFFWPSTPVMAGNARPLRAIYVLEPTHTNRPAVTSVAGLAKMAYLQRQAYRVEVVADLGCQSLLFQYATTLAQQIPVFRVERPKADFQLDELADSIRETWVCSNETEANGQPSGTRVSPDNRSTAFLRSVVTGPHD